MVKEQKSSSGSFMQMALPVSTIANLTMKRSTVQLCNAHILNTAFAAD